ncbi:zf-HC2 domain-containing protein [Flexivirga meconopsidis]|jgi:anti-sigma factor RsiW|uniref:zf-HC2 domain-containing protein n=1 Tax=Flexivirga meconopsidis TaxID=2977121 RepID=UPI0022400A90|nr:zf-HC2 domain-containing protein [Flexivirga meconopsidis]
MISFGNRQQQQQHLGDAVAEYVDGNLSPEQEHRADLHLMICEHCRHAVQQEREIIAQLRSVRFDSGGHQQLMAGLLSLAAVEPQGSGSAAAPVIPPHRPAPAVVTASAPPQYQSARRSMACALVAVAGCVGVALVASTATGAASGPEPTQLGGGNAPARLVRQLPAAPGEPTRPATRPSDPLPLIQQVAVRATP